MDLQFWGGIYVVAVAIFIVGCMMLITWPPADLSQKSKRRRKHR